MFKKFLAEFSRGQILGCGSWSEVPQPGFGILKQSHQPALFFAGQVRSAE
jgi:hypothetical protein